MKDKPAKAESINDIVAQHRKENASNPRNKQIDLASENVSSDVIKQEDLTAILEYNKNIYNIDDLYASVQPMSKILVKVFLFEPSKSENGLWVPYKQTLPVPTNAGIGSLMEMESPYPYSNKAIVVATPQMTSLKKGDVIQLESPTVRISGNAQNASIVVPNAYVHPNANSIMLSTDPSNQHYGYLLVPIHDVLAKV